jgi:acyl transferase domain-containing protein/acyl carrier protein
MNRDINTEMNTDDKIAIIGMAGRFPGANNIEVFWQNLCQGVESITRFADEELQEAGIDPALLQNPNYVKAKGMLEDIDLFDASFFGYSPQEAALIDPQQRIFLECAWEALEVAGYNPDIYEGSIGLYAGTGWSSYLFGNLASNPKLVDAIQGYQTLLANDKDYLATRVSYKLNLTGPSIDLQTACSTSLVATCFACQSLLNYQTDIVLAGGVSISVPQKAGYLYQNGGVFSPDGHCRPFDAKAQGMLVGNGVGIVVLKRLEDAIADGDTIQAVIRGWAINNDGAAKVGYTAPSVQGQAEVIAEALEIAEVDPNTLGYVEAHGTATELGDTIELRALTKAFGTSQRGYCGLGSVKSNVGHLDAAAGVTGLIKTVLALKHQQIPPTLHFQQPNPQLDFANSPFYVNQELQAWDSNNQPRRAGVSSLGIGGTNAHIVLEEAPSRVQAKKTSTQQPQLLLLSAKTETALETATTNLVEYLKAHPDLDLADVAYTLQVGRKAFPHRRALICEDIGDLETAQASALTHYHDIQTPPVTFLCSGQGSQYGNMGRGLYGTQPIFREQIDCCCELLQPHLGLDLREILYPADADSKATELLQQTSITQPAIFVIEYAIAQLWIHWGIVPQSLLGHSIGEYVAATLAGVFSLEDALKLVALRGQLMQSLPTGAMLTVSLSPTEIEPFLSPDVTLAVINAPQLCVVSGTHSAIEELEGKLTQQDISCRRLRTSHAFHSPMMTPILDRFGEAVSQITLHPPQIPIISNLTGTWLTNKEATDPQYWVKHLRYPVQFSAGMTELLQTPNRILLEIGAGRTLGTLARQHSTQAAGQVILSSLPHPKDQYTDHLFLLNMLARLWLAGAPLDWSKVQSQPRQRVPLPTYPFERQRYWIDPQPPASTSLEKPGKRPNLADWFYVPSWKQVPLIAPPAPFQHYLIFADEAGVGTKMVQSLLEKGKQVTVVKMGDEFQQEDTHTYRLNPEKRNDYHRLIESLATPPDGIAHCWSLTPSPLSLDIAQTQGFYSLLYLTQALEKLTFEGTIPLLVIANNLYNITGNETLSPEKSTLAGICKVIPQEYPALSCTAVDVDLSGSSADSLAQQLLQELHASQSGVVAYRGQHRWQQTFEPVPLNSPTSNRLRQGGVYLITGGTGGMGLVLAEHLAQTVQAKLVLISRSGVQEDGEKATETKKRIQALEALGAEVLVLKGDVSNREEMESAIALSLAHFGTIHGVIHTAGIPGSGLMSLKMPCEVASVFVPKVTGTLVLKETLNQALENPLDFFILSSSLNTVTGGVGQVDYCGANTFLDHFAQANPDCLAINWDTWQEVGMAINTSVPQALQSWREENLKNGLTSTEAIEVLHRVLNSSLSQVIVSTQSLKLVQGEMKNSLSLLSQEKKSKNKYELGATRYRKNSTRDYVSPRNKTEATVAKIWQELMGIESISIHDNFFELGGHSLLAVQTTSRLRETFGIDLPLRTLLFEAPTVAQLSTVITDTQSETEDEQDLEKLLAEIEQLSAKEAEAILAQESK